MPAKKKPAKKSLPNVAAKRRMKMKATTKKIPASKKGARYCKKCAYCDEGTTFKPCLRCGNCFCEYHAESWDYCDQCGSGKKKSAKTGKEKKSSKISLKEMARKGSAMRS
jgi:hypothetical protein